MFAGRPERAERRLRGDLATLERVGDCGMLATTQAMLAQALYAQGRRQEAQALCRRAAQLAATDDIVTRVLWRGVQARIAADAGDCNEGESLAREAVALVKATDLLTLRGDVMLDLVHVLRVAGKTYQDTARSALQLYGSKGNVAASLRASSMLEQHPGRETHVVQPEL
jgi:ATP/maltotriose-dependent transcriptional regulator MalT